MANKEFDVFLSHNSGDKPWVIALKAALAERGVKVWLDRDEIRPGDLFIDALEHGIEQSRAVALIVSPEAVKSSWVKLEYQRAMVLAGADAADLRVIPCLLRQAVLPGFLTTLQCIDFRDPAAFKQKVDDLCWGITGIKPGQESPAPEPPQVPDADVTLAEVRFLSQSIARERAELRQLMLIQALAPLLGVGVSAMFLRIPSAIGDLPLYLGPGVVAGLFGYGVTAKQSSKHRQERDRLEVHRDALELCRESPRPICSDVVSAFNRLIEQSLGIGAAKGGETPS
jgi:hypothetical protein